MGKKDKKKGKGAAKTAEKTDKKVMSKLRKELALKGEDDIEALIAQVVAEDMRREKVVEELTTPPSFRSSATLVAHPEKDILYLFGGEYNNGNKTSMYNDLFAYNIKKDTWTLIRSPNPPPPRCSHQSVVVPQGGGQMWVFGGEFASPTRSQFYHYKDLWVFHMKEKRWEQVQAAGAPSSRSGHRMVATANDLFVFGGFHESLRDCKYFNDVTRFSLSERKWHKVEIVNAGPTPRSGVQMVAISEGKIVIYGGYSREKLKKDSERGVTHNDMFILKQEPTGGKYRWSVTKSGGRRPSPRCGFALAPAPNHKAYCFGGVCDEVDDEEELEGSFCNDLYLFEADKGIWRLLSLQRDDVTTTPEGIDRLKINGDGMDVTSDETTAVAQQEEKDQSKEAVTVCDDGVFTVKIAAAGGATAVQDSTGNQVVKKESKFVPHPRMGAMMAFKGGILYMFGGIFEDGDRQYTLNDMYALDTHKMDEWKTIIPMDSKQLEWLESDDESETSDDDESSDGGDDEMECDTE